MSDSTRQVQQLQRLLETSPARSGKSNEAHFDADLMSEESWLRRPRIAARRAARRISSK
jgi:hypothetical protein